MDVAHPYLLPWGCWTDPVAEVMSHIGMLRFYLSWRTPDDLGEGVEFATGPCDAV